ncbi:reverse transcriptase domain, Reverse transcriptase zinc-binding domain protein [Artemisia annua]|uniref:Reverse transcriptase domain, Reverse transcriptase zinc-binding domain protein n=1 Tax=Artemisia annua TaxID=35608 RepID=A0A2U1NBI3_ARTAN|nr:reverse transcriptase domain, Reverse transcriptase zinc-binding domain protein [Artemisia annua]
MLDPDPTPVSMDLPPKPSDEFVLPKKSNKPNVSNKSRNIKKNSSKGGGRAKSSSDMVDTNEELDTMDGVEEGNEEAVGAPPSSKGVSQVNADGSNSGGMVADVGSFDGGNSGKVAEVGGMNACSVDFCIGKDSNVNTTSTNVEMPVPVHLNPVLNGLVSNDPNSDNVRDNGLFEHVDASVSLNGQANEVPGRTAKVESHTRNNLSFANAPQGMAGNANNKLRLYPLATFARVLVEVDAAKGLPGSIEVCYKSLGKSMCLGVEYAWSPPMCSHCKVFGHSFEACTKRELTEEEIAKMKEINDQYAQKTNGDVKDNEEWKNVTYKKVVKNGNEGSKEQGSQFANRGTYYSRNNASRGRGGVSGRGGYRNVQQGESSKTVDSQKVPMANKNSSEVSGLDNGTKMKKTYNRVNEQKKNVGPQDVQTNNRYSSLVDVDDDTNMVEGHNFDEGTKVGKGEISSSERLKNRIDALQREIVESNRSIGSNANKKAKEMMSERMKKSGKTSNVVLSSLYDEMYRMELGRIQDLTTSKQLLEVELFISLNTLFTEDLKNQWTDEMLEYFFKLKNEGLKEQVGVSGREAMMDEIMYCPFCNSCKDSHSHLFFACDFSRRLWERLKVMAKLDDLSCVWGEVVSGTVNKAASNKIWSIIQRLIFGAAVYFIWQERNFRIFKKCARSDEALFSLITETIRLRLIGLKILKVSNDVKDASTVWNFPLTLHSFEQSSLLRITAI